MRIKKALFLGTLCTAVSGMSLFAQAGVSYAKSAEKTTEAASSEEAESEEETSEEVTYPITIEHAFGETELRANQSVLQQSVGKIRILHLHLALHQLVFQQQTTEW